MKLGIPQRVTGLDGDEARFLVMNVVAFVFVKRQSNGCIDVLVDSHSHESFLGSLTYMGMQPCFLAGSDCFLQAS